MKNQMLKYTKVAMITEVSAVGDPQSLIEIIKAMLSGSEGSFASFLQYLNNTFSITNFESMSSSIMEWSKNMASGEGIGAKIFAGIASAISNAIKFATNLAQSILKATPQLNTLAFNGQFTYGTLLGMAAVAACALYVFSKIYKILKRKFYESTSNEDIIKYAKVSIQKAIIESEITFSKLSKITESIQLTEASLMMTLNNVVSKAWEICNDMLDWLSTIISSTVSATSEFVNRHPKFATAILVCIGMVVMYNKCPQVKNAVNSVRKAI